MLERDMDAGGFWRIINATARAAPDDLEWQTELLGAALAELSAGEFLDFDRWYTEHSHRLYTWRIWRAADLMIGDTSEDVFADFRSWVISRGRAAYEAVLADPDAGLAALPVQREGEINAGALFGAKVHGVYAEKTGREFLEDFPDRPFADFPQESPAGPRMAANRQERRQQYPRLAAKYPPRPEFDLPWREGANGPSLARGKAAASRLLLSGLRQYLRQ